jgi:hypothetical protein
MSDLCGPNHLLPDVSDCVIYTPVSCQILYKWRYITIMCMFTNYYTDIFITCAVSPIVYFILLVDYVRNYSNLMVAV